MTLITRPIVVVHLFAHRLMVGKTRVGRHTFITDRSETEWEPTTLADIFEEIKENYQTDTIRLVLDNHLAHTFEVTIPKKVTDLRVYLAEQVEAKVGEAPGPSEWDYRKAIFPLGKGSKATVFAPKKQILELITKAADKAEMTIESMEPAEIAKKRDEDPMIGIALKHDLVGADDEVLNISIEKTGGGGRLSWKLILIIILILLLGSIFIGAYLAWQKLPTRIEKEVPTETPPIVVQQEASPAVAEEVPLKLSDYKVQVLNGSGIAGGAGVLKAKLETAGFVAVEAKNADRFDYVGVTLQTKVGIPSKITETLNPLFSTTQTVTTGETLPATSTYDIVITLGK